MRTQIVYVLVSSLEDHYLEQAYISMFSLKYHMPESYITLITDRLTADSFTGIRKTETKYIDNLVVVDIDSNRYTAQQRSRQLKTSVRNLIDGDFLYVDCDTIITQSLDEIDSVEFEIAACRDTHAEFSKNPYRDMALRDGHLLGWPIDEEKDYFNGGVIYVKDTPITHEYYRLWNKNLTDGYLVKVFMDQPSFAKTNYEMNHIVKNLPDIWNCELKHGIRYLKDAKIVHYLTTNIAKYQQEQLFILNEKDALTNVKLTGEINDKILSVIKDPFKGLAEVTHCFAGDDVFFFRSVSYKYCRYHFVKGQYSYIDKLIFAKNNVQHFIKKVVQYGKKVISFLCCPLKIAMRFLK